MVSLQLLKFILPASQECPQLETNWKLISSTRCFEGCVGAKAQQSMHDLMFHLSQTGRQAASRHGSRTGWDRLTKYSPLFLSSPLPLFICLCCCFCLCGSMCVPCVCAHVCRYIRICVHPCACGEPGIQYFPLLLPTLSLCFEVAVAATMEMVFPEPRAH